MLNKAFALIMTAFAVAVWVLLIRLSLKAKPIGTKPHQRPYRWGTYVALSTGLISVVSLFGAIKDIANGRLLFAALGAILTVLCIMTCVLLLRRKRSGVPSFFATYGLIFIMPNILSTISGRNQTAEDIQEGTRFFYVFLLPTGYYMWKRWHLFNTPAEGSPTTAVQGPRFDTSTGKPL